MRSASASALCTTRWIDRTVFGARPSPVRVAALRPRTRSDAYNASRSLAVSFSNGILASAGNTCSSMLRRYESNVLLRIWLSWIGNHRPVRYSPSVSFSVATDTPWLRRFTRSVTSFSASLRRGPAETHLRFSLPVPGSTPS